MLNDHISAPIVSEVLKSPAISNNISDHTQVFHLCFFFSVKDKVTILFLQANLVKKNILKNLLPEVNLDISQCYQWCLFWVIQHANLSVSMVLAGEKPFRCNQCMHSFVSSGVLKAHMRTHTGIKGFKCLICDTSFTTNGSLKRHMSTHSENRPFMCPYCQKTFKTSVNCKKHMKTHRWVFIYMCLCMCMHMCEHACMCMSTNVQDVHVPSCRWALIVMVKRLLRFPDMFKHLVFMF